MKTLLSIVLLLVAARGFAVTNAVSSLTFSNIQDAINLCNHGDVVTLPAGSVTFTNTQYLSITKNIQLIGSGVDVTYIKWGWNSGSGRKLIQWNPVASNTSTSRLTGITFANDGGTDVDEQGTLNFSGSSTNMRIDHCEFVALPDAAIAFYGSMGGLIDHCTVSNSGTSRLIMFFNGGGDSWGDRAWTNHAAFGSGNAVTVEDCEVYRTSSVYGSMDGWIGGRVAFRYNRLFNSRVGNHGTESSQRYRSGRSMEIFGNYISNSLTDTGQYMDNRGGAMVVWSNTIVGESTTTIKLNAYRVLGADPPWGAADGTKLWDAADLTDGVGTPYGAGDGIFEIGTSDSGGLRTLGDSSKSWTTNQWVGYSLREVYTNTATSGGVRSAVVSGAGWTVNQWSGYEFTKTIDNTKGRVSSNTSDTLTLGTDYYAVNMTGGGEFILSTGTYIDSNTSTQLVVRIAHDSSETFPTSCNYQIRRVTFVLDQPGAGISTMPSGSPPGNQSLSQGHTEPVYGWGNTLNAASASVSAGGYYSIQSDRDYFNHSTSFNGSSGMGIGTRSEMEAITGTTTNVSFWVTDEGTWNRLTSGEDGRLYKWDGAEWDLYYEPLTYPHPLNIEAQTAPLAPTGVSASNRERGVKLTWAAPDYCDAYKVLRATSSGGTFSEIAFTANLSYTNTPLATWVPYYYKIQGSNSYGLGTLSAEVTAYGTNNTTASVTNATAANVKIGF